jgi:hypothetical protein
MEDATRKAGRPKGKRRDTTFSTVFSAEERRYLQELAADWDMPQNHVIGRLLRFAKFGEPLPSPSPNSP